MKPSLRAGALAGLWFAASALAFAPSAVLAQPAAASADAVFAATTLNLTAHGETEVPPDQATVTLGVQSTAPTAQAAMAQNAQLMNSVVVALHKAGIADRDIRTTNLNLSAQYAYPQDKPAVLTGYVAGNDVAVTVNDLTRVGAAIDAVTAAGANQIEGIAFGLKDASAAEDAARQAAVKALSAKAALYASASGYHLQRLVSLSEEATGIPGPVRPMMMAKAASTPVMAGQLTVRVDVSGLYELAK